MGAFLRLQISLRVSTGSPSHLVQIVPALVSQKATRVLAGRLLHCFLVNASGEEACMQEMVVELSVALEECYEVWG